MRENWEEINKILDEAHTAGCCEPVLYNGIWSKTCEKHGRLLNNPMKDTAILNWQEEFDARFYFSDCSDTSDYEIKEFIKTLLLSSLKAQREEIREKIGAMRDELMSRGLSDDWYFNKLEVFNDILFHLNTLE